MIPKNEGFAFSISNCNDINRLLKKRANKDGEFLPIKTPKINFTITFFRKSFVKSGLFGSKEVEESASYIVNGFIRNHNDTHQSIAEWLHEQNWVERQAQSFQYFFKNSERGTFYISEL